MNVCFITIDCLREDFLSKNYADTPFLDSLASRSYTFSQMYSTTTTTTPSVASFFTGRYSENNGINTHHNVDLREDIDTLAEKFQKNKYNTYAMSTGPLVEETGLDRGFDKYWYRDRNKNLTNEWKSKAIRKRDCLSEPFFLYLHLWELHLPTHVPDEFDSKEYGDFKYERINEYARTLSALDRHLEEFINGLPENTIIVMHGDHGEFLTGVKNQYYDLLRKVRNKLRYQMNVDVRPLERVVNRIAKKLVNNEIKNKYVEEAHGHTVYDVETNVPFLLFIPEHSEGNYAIQCRQVDIYPTLLEAANIEYYDNLDGQKLVPPENISSRKAYIRACGPPNYDRETVMRAIRIDGYKYIEFPHRKWEPELYNISADPYELYPISDSKLMDHMKGAFPSGNLRDTEELEIEELLKDLGYM